MLETFILKEAIRKIIWSAEINLWRYRNYEKKNIKIKKKHSTINKLYDLKIMSVIVGLCVLYRYVYFKKKKNKLI